LSRTVTVNSKRKTLQTYVPITSKNSASVCTGIELEFLNNLWGLGTE
jgi:hypothetical protein